MDHMFADAFQFFVDSAGFYHIAPQGVSEGVGHGADGAVLDESVQPGRPVAFRGVVAVSQVVEQRRGVEQRLKGRVQVASVPDVEHSGSGRPMPFVTDLDRRQVAKHHFGHRDGLLSSGTFFFPTIAVRRL